jgi:uncharacterized protein GlcG (DUF336 family)
MLAILMPEKAWRHCRSISVANAMRGQAAIDTRDTATGRVYEVDFMRQAIISLCVTGLMALVPSASALAQSSGLPGDHGRMMDGILPANPPPRPQGPPMPGATVRAPGIDLALQAAQTIAQGCKQYALGVAVVNAQGAPILIYVPDGSDPSHGYTAVRKGYTAITFKVDTSQLVKKGQQDSDFAAKVKADPNLMAFSGGVLLKVGDEIIGAIGVSGAEPGHHDEECGLKGLNKIRKQLK